MKAMHLPLILLVKQKDEVHQQVQAVTLFSHLRQAGLQPNAITFTTLMKAYQRSGQLQNAKSTFAAAQQAGQANIVATNAFIDVLVDDGQLNLASQVGHSFSSKVHTQSMQTAMVGSSQ
jgi:hypothetical protein